jgi:cysteine desulfurase/selenocysteine lyase
MTPNPSPANQTTFDPEKIRTDFPILQQTIHRNRPLVYFDNGASTQHPQSVIDVMTDCYQRTYANVHRGIHWLSEQSSAQYESARQSVQHFMGAAHDNEIVFTSGTTASINLVAHSWGDENLSAGDEILLTIFEHHSNIVPWQQCAARTGAVIKWAGITDEGELDLHDLQNQISERTKLVSFSAVSNVLGTKTPVAEIVRLAKLAGATTFVDAAQHVPHESTNVQDWDADFVAFSGHKMCGPSGIGILYGRQTLLESMPPFLGGGSMISKVTTDGFSPGELPAKFEAGTPPIVEAIGLAAAIDYLTAIGLDSISHHETTLATAAINALQSIDGLTVLGPPADRRAGLVSFVVHGVSPQDIAVLLDQAGIAIRAGHHCAMPLHDHLGHRASSRASFYLYNTLEEIDSFAAALTKVVKRLV